MKKFTVAEFKEYAQSFLLRSNCGDDAQNGGAIENTQLWIMLGNIDYPTGKGTIEDWFNKK